MNTKGKMKRGNKNHYIKRPVLKTCPFCNCMVTTHVSARAIRFFDCPCCGASTVFQGENEDNSIECWNSRGDNN